MMRSADLILQLCCCIGFSSLLWSAQGCDCEPTLLKSFQNADVVLKATLTAQLNSTLPSSTFEPKYAFSAKIVQAFKGCSRLKGLETITVDTGSQEDICGLDFLQSGTTYLLSGSFDPSRKSVFVHSCEYQSEWTGLSATQLNQVDQFSKKYSNCTCTPTSCGPRPSNYRCLDGVTVGGPTKCSYNQKRGACAWNIVQCPTCHKQSDCRKGQFCSAGKCRAVGTCGSDVDCWNPKNEFVNSKSNSTSGIVNGTPRCSIKNSTCYRDNSHICAAIACVVDPCAVAACKEPHSACVRKYCSGCDAIFFNSSGYQVCKASSKNNTDVRI